MAEIGPGKNENITTIGPDLSHLMETIIYVKIGYIGIRFDGSDTHSIEALLKNLISCIFALMKYYVHNTADLIFPHVQKWIL